LIAKANLALKRKAENEQSDDSSQLVETAPSEVIDDYFPHQAERSTFADGNSEPLFRKKPAERKPVETDASTESNLITDMAELASRMKESTLVIQSRLSADNAHLDAAANTVEKNIASIASVNDKLSSSSKNDVLGLCATFGLLALSVLIFVIAYISIKILPAP
jgi:hypothetical protein